MTHARRTQQDLAAFLPRRSAGRARNRARLSVVPDYRSSASSPSISPCCSRRTFFIKRGSARWNRMRAPSSVVPITPAEFRYVAKLGKTKVPPAAKGKPKKAASYIDRDLTFRILEIKDAGKRIVVSRSDILREERQALLENLHQAVKSGMSGVIFRSSWVSTEKKYSSSTRYSCTTNFMNG